MTQVLLTPSDKANLIGELSIDFVLPDGTKVPYLRESPNRITNNAREHLLRLIAPAQTGVGANPILEFRVGNGGGTSVIPTGSELTLASPAPSGGTLYYGGYNPHVPTPNALYNPTAISVQFQIGNPRICTITFALSNADCDTLTINEVGLFATGPWLQGGTLATTGKLFSIKTFADIVKTNGFGVAFTWKLNFSGVS